MCVLCVRDSVCEGRAVQRSSERLRETTAVSERETMRERGITTQGEGVHEGEDEERGNCTQHVVLIRKKTER